MSHSKRNTSLAYFTSHERSLLRSNWGTQSTRLTRESFLPFGFCRLCLGYAREPVACSAEGVGHGSGKARVHLFCRECALNDLMAQRKEIKRLERESEVRGREEQEDQAREEDERKRAELEKFERNELGFEDGANRTSVVVRTYPRMKTATIEADGAGSASTLILIRPGLRSALKAIDEPVSSLSTAFFITSAMVMVGPVVSYLFLDPQGRRLVRAVGRWVGWN